MLSLNAHRFVSNGARTAAIVFITLAAFSALPSSALADTSPTLTTYTVSQGIIYPGATLPLATSTTITIGFSTQVKVALKIVDGAGATVRALYSSNSVTNPAPKLWDGKNDAGVVVPPGTYTVSIIATSTATTTLAMRDVSKTIVVALHATVPPPDTTLTSVPYRIPLTSSGNGWNLVSLPVIPVNTNPSAVLGDASTKIDSVWTYDPSDPAADASGWLVYSPAHPELSNLTRLTAGYGYFIHASSTAELEGSGALFSALATPPLRNLMPGWNLVGAYGLPNMTEWSVDDAFASIGFAGIEYTALWKLDTSSGDFETPEEVHPTDAFWILLDAPHQYAPTNL